MEMILWNQLGEWEHDRLDMIAYPYYLIRFSCGPRIVMECPRDLNWLSYEN